MIKYRGGASWAGGLVSALLIVLPALCALGLALQASPIPDVDYWFMTATFGLGEVFSYRRLGWLVVGNEHIVSLLAGLFWLNIKLSSGSNQFLSLFAWLAMCAQLGFFVAWIRHDRRINSSIKPVMMLFVAAMVFHLGGAHNILKGMEGLAWHGCNMLAVACCHFISRYLTSGRRSYLFATLFLAVCASFHYGPGLFVWPACLLAVCVRRPLRGGALVTLAAGAIVMAVLYAYCSVRPERHPELFGGDLRNIVFFILALIGQPFSLQRPLSFGLIGLYFAFRHPRQLLDHARDGGGVWFVLLLYSVICMGAMWAARSGFGEGFALHGRYMPAPAMFWIALAGLKIERVQRVFSIARQPALLAWPLVCALVILIQVDRIGVTRDLLVLQESKDVAALSLILDAADEQFVGQSISGGYNQFFFDVLPYFRKIKHIPFDGGNPGSHMLNRPAAQLSTGQDKVTGTCVQGEEYRTGSFRIVCRSEQLDSRMRDMLVADASGGIVGIARRVKYTPPWSPVPAGAEELPAVWAGYAVLGSVGIGEAFVYDSAGGFWLRLIR